MKNIIKISYAFIALCALTSCKKTFFEAEPAADPVAVFEQFWSSFQENYAPFEERKVDWQAQYQIFRPQLDPAMSDEQLHRVLTQMIAPLNDGHVKINAPDRPVYIANDIRNRQVDKELFDLNLICQKYLNNKYVSDADASFVYGLLPGDIIYAHFPYVGAPFQRIGEALQRFDNARGLVVDLRRNDGGDFTYAFSEMGRFTDQKRLVFASKTKNGPGKDDYTPWYEWHIEPKGAYFDKKIVVLTDRYTISAGERAAMAFSVLPNCVSVGDTTNGAHSTMIWRELANGWYFSLATQKVRCADGRSYEGVGLPPDVYVKNAAAEMREGKDRALETAIALF